LLYRLYLESGALINVSDLWSAFNAILEDGGEEDSSKVMSVLRTNFIVYPETQILTCYGRPLFQQALAELKSLGLLKSSRKKTDHIAKAAWRGL
jgi:origin recognition complex subunit 3